MNVNLIKNGKIKALVILLFNIQLSLCLPHIVLGQNQTVSGTVTDAQTGEALIGVSIAVKGTSLGTSTDAQGHYSLNIPSLQDTLRFSFIGYQTQEVPVRGRTAIHMKLKPVVISGNEIVVVGYGTQKREDVTGSISTLGADDFNKGVVSSPKQLMNGRVAGVSITSNSGAPGADAVVQIRGTTSISADNNPLYVINGIPIETHTLGMEISATGTGGGTPIKTGAPDPLNMINPSDIESINILKGPSAEAIYGSRAANGVVIIRTKTSERSLVSYSGYVGVSTVPKELPVLSAGEYIKYAKDHDLQYPDKGANTNWQDQIFRTAVTQNHNLSIGGFSKNASYRASFGYMNQNGIIIGTNMKTYNANLGIDKRAINDKLDLQMQIIASKSINNQAALSHRQGGAGGNIMIDAIRWAPTLPVRNADGSFYQIGPLRVNPASWPQLTDENQKEAIIGSIKANYKVTDWLSATVHLGYTSSHLNRNNYIPMSNPVGAQENGRAIINDLWSRNYLIEYNLQFEKELSKNSRMKFLAGYSFQRFINSSRSTSAHNFPSDVTKWNLIQAGTTLSNTSNLTANRLASVYGRLNYALKDRYLLTATLRRDGSSRFGENKKWGVFPSGAIGWIISKEGFFSTETINNLKIRAEYGVTGNQGIPDNLYRAQLSVGSSIYEFGGNAVPSIALSNYANPDLQWERTGQFDIGLDFGLFQDRLTGTIDYYKKVTNDLLLAFSTASPSAVSTQWANVGQVNNKGFEIQINGGIIRTDKIQWDAGIVFSRNRNKVISLSNDVFSRSFIRQGGVGGKISTVNTYTQIIKPGLPIGTFFGRKYTGLDADGMETYLKDDEGNVVMGPIGNANPDFTYGITSALNWRRINVAITFKGVSGNDIFNETAAEYSYKNVLPGENVLRSALHDGVSPKQSPQYSSRWLENGSYLRLQNLTIGYDFNIDQVPFLSKAYIYLSGENLFVITKYSGYDPEVHALSQGIDFMTYPRPRTIQFGVNVSFN